MRRDSSEGGFHRGITVPANFRKDSRGRMDIDFPGDVVIRDGRWERGLTVFDVADEPGSRDVILKGAKALDYQSGRAAVYIGHPRGGTVLDAPQPLPEEKQAL
ncbi:hypothetical protein [Methanothermobacter sp.]|uniref:hypothetical protein n=1 Tax=Methanothermobacter sp. TaxID=1884223 RepID=UPI003C793D0B